MNLSDRKNMKKRSRIKKVAHQDMTKLRPMPDVIRAISERLNARLKEGRERGQIIDHNLEYGLGTENVVRNLIREMMPLKYGVGKGKIINFSGASSRHLDIIIYDSINYPTLFVDEHQNQFLPIESVYSVIEVKSRTTSSVLKDAFENLESVAEVAGVVSDCSTNNLVERHPPYLSVLSFEDTRSLETICDNYVRLSENHPRAYSYSRYSERSPAYKENTGHCYLVSSIYVIGKGEVYHMLDGRVAIGRWGANSFGMFVTSLLADLAQVKLPDFKPTFYIGWLQSGAREIYERES